jgi:hypothetical protein
MMTLSEEKHKNTFIKILKDIYQDNTIGPILGFKGGTAAFLFYNLNRFSVDLDFDLLDPDKEGYVFERIEKIILNYGVIKTKRIKRFTIFFKLSYAHKDHNIKVEINRRSNSAEYEVLRYLGIPMKVMVREDMFANKLIAMCERIDRTNRDIYDVWFFLNNNWPINAKLIEGRTGVKFKNYLKHCIKMLEGIPERSILAGIGELLDNKQKIWAKENLKQDTLFLLKLKLRSIDK